MSASTKAELRAAIKQESRIKTGTNLDDMVDNIVADIMRDYANKTRYYELLTENVAITLVNAQQSYNLPADFMNLYRVRFGRGTVPVASTGFRELFPETDNTKRTYAQGYPLYYRLIAGPKISLWPYASLLATDYLQLDYYLDPATLYDDDADLFPIPRLESAVKKEAIARVQRFSASLNEAQLTDKDGSASWIASESANR